MKKHTTYYTIRSLGLKRLINLNFMKSFEVFKCGHSFHTKCLLAIQDVKNDIHDEIKNYRTLELLNSNATIPSRRAIVDLIWKKHKLGKRSYFYQHELKIKALNDN